MLSTGANCLRWRQSVLAYRVHATFLTPRHPLRGNICTNQRAREYLILSGLLATEPVTATLQSTGPIRSRSSGYTCIRVDLPGSCDSGGDAPAEFMRFIDAGSYEAVTAEIIKQVTVRYNLSSVIIMGHCTGR